MSAKRVPSVCDYSLDLVASRPANVGDKLVTTKFQYSMTRGFAAIGEPNMAVCLLPGTEVAFEKEVQYERLFVLFPGMKHGKLGKRCIRSSGAACEGELGREASLRGRF